MQPLIKFVKGNLVPLICGLVVLLSIGAIFWPIGSWTADLQDQMSLRSKQVSMVNQLKSDITLPGGQVLTGATYESNVIAAASAEQKKMAAQAAEVQKTAAEQNQRGRVVSGADGKLVPLLAGKPEDNYLPKIGAGALPYSFVVDYNRIFKTWTTELVGNEVVSPIPPTMSEITEEFVADQKRAAQPINGAPMFAGAAHEAASGTPDAAYVRGAISRRASQIHMYVDPVALFKSPWASGAIPPNESQIFEGIVDSWFQQDVINAIVETNKGSTNVGSSPVKRLERIVVGVPANVLSAYAPGPSPFLSLDSSITIPPSGIDISRDLTGRVGGGTTDYDVVVTYIGVDLDPAYENAFIANLYKQNNGYTVLNINTHVLDPFETSAQGYLYGNVQAVHLDMLVEGLMYRSWTKPLMPNYVRGTLGLPNLPSTP